MIKPTDLDYTAPNKTFLSADAARLRGFDLKAPGVTVDVIEEDETQAVVKVTMPTANGGTVSRNIIAYKNPEATGASAVMSGRYTFGQTAGYVTAPMATSGDTFFLEITTTGLVVGKVYNIQVSAKNQNPDLEVTVTADVTSPATVTCVNGKTYVGLTFNGLFTNGVPIEFIEGTILEVDIIDPVSNELMLSEHLLLTNAPVTVANVAVSPNPASVLTKTLDLAYSYDGDGNPARTIEMQGAPAGVTLVGYDPVTPIAPFHFRLVIADSVPANTPLNLTFLIEGQVVQWNSVYKPAFDLNFLK